MNLAPRGPPSAADPFPRLSYPIGIVCWELAPGLSAQQKEQVPFEFFMQNGSTSRLSYKRLTQILN